MLKIVKRMLMQKIVLSEGEKGLLFNHKQFIRVLDAGQHRLSRLGNDYEVRTFNIKKHKGLQTSEEVLFLLKKYPARFVDSVDTVNTTSSQIAFIYNKDMLVDVLPPSQEAFLWKTAEGLHVEYQEVEDTSVIDKALFNRIKQQTNVFQKLYQHELIAAATIAEQHKGLQYTDDCFVAVLPAGKHAWWTINANMKVVAVDMRLQNMEISGQEILTKDRVSIRLNLLATWQVTDVEKLVLQVKNYTDFLYREMQLALRTVVATKTLDELLADKNLLNSEIRDLVEPMAAEYGIHLKTVGVKDVILPGEMKDILSKVVEAQKTAEANIIKRREETQATRSLHNTAKVMENNPVLLRLKELESLEKITSQIGQLNVYGGLDGVMNGLVDLRSKPNTSES